MIQTKNRAFNALTSTGKPVFVRVLNSKNLIKER